MPPPSTSPLSVRTRKRKAAEEAAAAAAAEAEEENTDDNKSSRRQRRRISENSNDEDDDDGEFAVGTVLVQEDDSNTLGSSIVSNQGVVVGAVSPRSTRYDEEQQEDAAAADDEEVPAFLHIESSPYELEYCAEDSEPLFQEVTDFYQSLKTWRKMDDATVEDARARFRDMHPLRVNPEKAFLPAACDAAEHARLSVVLWKEAWGDQRFGSWEGHMNEKRPVPEYVFLMNLSPRVIASARRGDLQTLHTRRKLLPEFKKALKVILQFAAAPPKTGGEDKTGTKRQGRARGGGGAASAATAAAARDHFRTLCSAPGKALRSSALYKMSLFIIRVHYALKLCGYESLQHAAANLDRSVTLEKKCLECLEKLQQAIPQSNTTPTTTTATQAQAASKQQTPSQSQRSKLRERSPRRDVRRRDSSSGSDEDDEDDEDYYCSETPRPRQQDGRQDRHPAVEKVDGTNGTELSRESRREQERNTEPGATREGSLVASQTPGDSVTTVVAHRKSPPPSQAEAPSLPVNEQNPVEGNMTTAPTSNGSSHQISSSSATRAASSSVEASSHPSGALATTSATRTRSRAAAVDDGDSDSSSELLLEDYDDDDDDEEEEDGDEKVGCGEGCRGGKVSGDHRSRKGSAAAVCNACIDDDDDNDDNNDNDDTEVDDLIAQCDGMLHHIGALQSGLQKVRAYMVGHKKREKKRKEGSTVTITKKEYQMFTKVQKVFQTFHQEEQAPSSRSDDEEDDSDYVERACRR